MRPLDLDNLGAFVITKDDYATTDCAKWFWRKCINTTAIIQ